MSGTVGADPAGVCDVSVLCLYSGRDGHDTECEAEWIDIAYSYSDCGCAERAERAGEEAADEYFKRERGE